MMSEAAAVGGFTEAGTSRIVEAGKWKIHINEAGEGHPIIMLHGTGPGATGWSNFSQNLQDLAKKYRVILMDAVGWGKSDPMPPAEGGLDSPAAVESLKALLDALGIEKAALVGNSMGGATTLRFCAAYPERVSHAITMGAGFFQGNLFSPAGPSQGIRILSETYANPTPENFRRLVNIMVFDPSYATEELLQERSARALANRDHLTNWLEARKGVAAPDWSVMGELMAKLSKFKAPAMLIHGRDDRVVSMEATLRAASILPNARAVIINRCGHWAQLEHAHEFNRLVDTFLSGSAEGGRLANSAGFGG